MSQPQLCFDCGHPKADHANYIADDTHCTHGEEGEYDAGAERMLAVGGCDCTDYVQSFLPTRFDVAAMASAVADLPADKVSQSSKMLTQLLRRAAEEIGQLSVARDEARSVATELLADLYHGRETLMVNLPWEDRSQPDDRLIVESVRELPPRRTERMS